MLIDSSRAASADCRFFSSTHYCLPQITTIVFCQLYFSNNFHVLCAFCTIFFNLLVFATIKLTENNKEKSRAHAVWC